MRTASILMMVMLPALRVSATVPAPPMGSWTTAPAMPVARAAHAVAVADGALYVLAGTGADGQPVLEVDRFDGKAWRPEAQLPGHGLNAPTAAAIGSRIYLIGGFDMTTNVPTTQVLV